MYGWVYLVKDKSNVTYKIGVTRTNVKKESKDYRQATVRNFC